MRHPVSRRGAAAGTVSLRWQENRSQVAWHAAPKYKRSNRRFQDTRKPSSCSNGYPSLRDEVIAGVRAPVVVFVVRCRCVQLWLDAWCFDRSLGDLNFRVRLVPSREFFDGMAVIIPAWQNPFRQNCCRRAEFGPPGLRFQRIHCQSKADISRMLVMTLRTVTVMAV